MIVKQATVKKAFNRGSESLASIAKANDIGRSTLYKWLKCYQENPCWPDEKTSPSISEPLSLAVKCDHLVQTSALYPSPFKMRTLALIGRQSSPKRTSKTRM